MDNVSNLLTITLLIVLGCCSAFGQSEITLTKNEKDTYALLTDSLYKNEKILKGLSLILGKRKIPNKYLRDGKPKLKTSHFLYKNVSNVFQTNCNNYKITDKDELFVDTEMKSISNDLSTSRNYLVYFSRIHGNYVECKIVANSKGTTEEAFYGNTRFGTVLLVQFCTEANTITDIFVNTYRAS